MCVYFSIYQSIYRLILSHTLPCSSNPPSHHTHTRALRSPFPQMRHLLVLGVIAADILLVSDGFILKDDDVIPIFPDLPAPFIPTLGVIAANGLMPLFRATLYALEVRICLVLYADCFRRRKWNDCERVCV